MNDRYLFKAKRKDWKDFPKEEQWVYGYYVRGFNLFEEPIHVVLDPTTIFDANTTDGFDEVDESTICQCTGLRDKDKNLIWENDIVKAWSEGRCAVSKIKQRIDGTWIMYPAWQNGEMWYLLPDEKGYTTVEVIGNIFDNPELLEVE